MPQLEMDTQHGNLLTNWLSAGPIKATSSPAESVYVVKERLQNLVISLPKAQFMNLTMVRYKSQSIFRAI